MSYTISLLFDTYHNLIHLSKYNVKIFVYISYQSDTSGLVEYTKGSDYRNLRNSAKLSCIVCIRDVTFM
jgi:hypothetical protein